MFFGYEGWTMLLVLPGLALAIFAQFKVRNTFQRYSAVRSAGGRSGAQIAIELLRRRGVHNVKVERVEGSLSDHYDPRTKILRLSPEVHDSDSVAAIGVAAHECGHALQDNEKYAPLVARSAFVPVANLGSSAAYILFIIGLVTSIRPLMDIGILLFVGYVAFALITLPVEFDASRRAVAVLQGEGLVMPSEADGARAVLNAAALTYIAAAAMAVLNLVRLLVLRSRSDD